MRRLYLVMFVSISALAVQPRSVLAQQLECNIGPVSKIYGGTPWLVYSCSDGLSLTLVTAPESRARPFYFIFHWEQNGYRLAGEGTGDKTLTDAAFKEISAFSQTDIQTLLDQTKRH
jgi:hypothetical protein